MVAVVFLDLKKAFDTVDHDILVSKLDVYGIKAAENNWFKSYLNGRNQKCFVNDMFITKPFINLRYSPRDIPWTTIIFIIHKRITKLPIVFAASNVCRRHSPLDLFG